MESPPGRHGTTGRGPAQCRDEVEYRKFADLGHGFGPGVGTSAEGWLDDAVRFWAKTMNRSN